MKSHSTSAAAKELNTKYDKYEQFYHHAPDMFLSVNLHDGKIKDVNTTTLRKLGYSLTQLIGKKVEKVFAPNTKLPIKSILNDILNRSKIENKEFEIFTSSGEKIPVLLNASSIPVGESDSALALLICRNIGNYANKQAEINATNNSLEEEVFERTKQLRKRNRELEQFAFIASHDLQEPLLTISNYSGRLLKLYREALDEHGQKSLEFIAQATQRMQGLIQALLDYGLIGQKQEVEKVDLNVLINEIAEDYHEYIEQGSVKLDSGQLPTIYGLRLELRQLFQNLLSNCLKFKKVNENCAIKVWAEKEDDHFHFRVQDNGIGIAAEHQQKIFKLFQRLHDHNTIQGTGIGLAQCVKIVDMHGGEMWVESEPNKGSIFHFTMKEFPSIVV